MRTFHDNAAQQWTIDLTIGTVLRVKSASDGRFDLLRPDQKYEHPDFGSTILQVAVLMDLPLFWELLYLVVEPQCESRGLSAIAFAEQMGAGALIAARNAFREEWRDFFLGLQRHEIAKALEKIGEWIEAGTKAVAARMEAADLTQLDAEVASQMTTILNRPFGGSPAL